MQLCYDPAMVRSQLLLDPEIQEALRRRAFEERKSMSAVAREILREALKPRPPKKGRKGKHPYDWDWIGRFHDTATDVAERHDDYLNEGDRW